jgi:hypothetical protein
MDTLPVSVQRPQTYRASYWGEQHPGFDFHFGVAYVTKRKMIAMLSLTTCH